MYMCAKGINFVYVSMISRLYLGSDDVVFLFFSLITTITQPGLDVFLVQSCPSLLIVRERRGRDSMVVGFTATYITSTYHH
jgi:hypothetical protein